MDQPPLIERIRTYRFSPTQILVIGYLVLIASGTFLLSLPFAAQEGRDISLMDAVFTATSAICVTGLIIKDTPVDFSLFGQLVILLLVQLGGMGYMSAATLLLLLVGKRIGLRERMVIQETLSTFTLGGLVRFLKNIAKFVLLVELVGAIFLTARFMSDYPFGKAAYLGIFHSISAFNNSGFSLFKGSMAQYREDWVTNGVMILLILMGGIGFLVYQDVRQWLNKEVSRISLHSKVVLVATAGIVFFGWAGFLVFEHDNPRSLGVLPWHEMGLTSLFQTVSIRTAGFSTTAIAPLSEPTLYLLILLMFVGGSPGSTGGGIKTTTLAVMIVSLWATMRGREEATIFYRRIPSMVIAKAFFLAALAMMLVTGETLLLLYTEGQPFLRTLFEVTSAAGTVGMSTGDGAGRSFCAVFT
ncbi:MAG TPA: potassium transporter TrkG, partial [Nitrospiria bacterium]|nr:potassium transporter TrkG [Nitrospiria bacterium]